MRGGAGGACLHILVVNSATINGKITVSGENAAIAICAQD